IAQWRTPISPQARQPGRVDAVHPRSVGEVDEEPRIENLIWDLGFRFQSSEFLARRYNPPMPNLARSKWILVLIGIEKLTKAALLIFVAIQAHRLILSPDAAAMVQHWVHQIRVDPDNGHIHGLVARLTGMSHRRLRLIS